ncbi:GFA family protein [Albidovulum sp.]|jgi:hypothetical protein|uniref:GFA family protein n=3 Tax=Albidovulum sp. TaxID=1872424 RepID=UPI00307129ED
MAPHPHTGGCLCGGVRFQADPPLREIVACHCGQCRRWSGHVWAATSVPLDRFRLTAEATLRWFASSAAARRGFCTRCGSSLFWQPAHEDRIAIAAGALDATDGLRLVRHIHTGDAGDYYRPEGPPPPPARDGPRALDCACLCGGVAFRLPGPAGPVTACHCRQCRRLSGHYAASFDADEGALHWLRRDTLGEYETPADGRRGFCTRCGSSLWFRSAAGEFSVEAGAVAGPIGGRLAEHIFVASKGDYYSLDDGLPQSGRW